MSAVAVAVTVLLFAEDIEELAHDPGIASMALVMLDGRQLLAVGYCSNAGPVSEDMKAPLVSSLDVNTLYARPAREAECSCCQMTINSLA